MKVSELLTALSDAKPEAELCIQTVGMSEYDADRTFYRDVFTVNYFVMVRKTIYLCWNVDVDVEKVITVKEFRDFVSPKYRKEFTIMIQDDVHYQDIDPIEIEFDNDEVIIKGML